MSNELNLRHKRQQHFQWFFFCVLKKLNEMKELMTRIFTKANIIISFNLLKKMICEVKCGYKVRLIIKGDQLKNSLFHGNNNGFFLLKDILW